MVSTLTETIEPRALEHLRGQFRGALLRPGEEGYDEARRIWNGGIDRYPALIARCAGADDVATAVRFARERDLLISVRGGGHAVAGHAVCDGGIMIDLSLMKAIRVDPAARTARAAGGVLWGELDRATQSFALATTGGVIGHTGIGGLTLGGGLGHLMRKHGLTVDNLLSVDLVTANAERMHVDAESEPELFWGVRGGGGNFGIVTSFEYQLHPVGPLVLGGPIVWPLADTPMVLRFVRDYASEAPDELGITIGAMLAPPMPILPTDRYGTPVLTMLLVWVGDPAAAEQAIAPLKAIGSPITELVRPTPYVALQSMLDNGSPHGRHYYWKSHRIPGLADAIIDEIVRRVTAITSPFSQIAMFTMVRREPRRPRGDCGGRTRDRLRGQHRRRLAGVRRREPAPCRRVREGSEAMRPFSTGVYANFLSDEGASGVEAAYGGRLQRLTALKDRYDPTNVFRLNANIGPSRCL